MTKTIEHGSTKYSSTTTDKGAMRDHDGHVVFGRFEMDNGVERFVVAHYPRSKSYKSERGADRAVAKWMAA